MALSKADFERLRTSAGSFATKNHAHFLAEAMQCIRSTGDPTEALILLRAMWGSPYASRSDQRIALNDIGKWLEQLLERLTEPGKQARQHNFTGSESGIGSGHGQRAGVRRAVEAN